MKQNITRASFSILISAVGIGAAYAQSTEAPKPAATPTWPVAGIWMPNDAKDLGVLTGQSWLSGVKVRGWVDGYYVVNRNRPDRATVDANQGTSVVKGSNVSVEGRTFDIQRSRPSLSLAEVEIEKIPERGGFGFKLDLAAGKTQGVIADTIGGALGPAASRSTTVGPGRNIQHASVSYLAPIGNGLRIDAGKLVTHIGAETIETAKNWNYSHGFFYTYAIPFQDTGVRMNYAWSDTLYTELYVVQGWNVTRDNNPSKTWGPSIGWTPIPWLSIVANYLQGAEQNDNNANKRKLFDTQITAGPFFERLTLMLNYDRGTEQRVPPTNTTDVSWSGTTLYARYKINDRFEPTLRIEHYRDPDGFTTGVPQTLRGYSLTWNTKFIPSPGAMLMIRPEIRYDKSSANFFTNGSNFRSRNSQLTYGIGATYIF